MHVSKDCSGVEVNTVAMYARPCSSDSQTGLRVGSKTATTSSGVIVVRRMIRLQRLFPPSKGRKENTLKDARKPFHRMNLGNPLASFGALASLPILKFITLQKNLQIRCDGSERKE